MKKKRREKNCPGPCFTIIRWQSSAELAGIEIINVGDSIANVMFGEESTLPADLYVMVEHAKAVRKGSPSAFIMGDMPFLSYQVSIPSAIRNAGRYLKRSKYGLCKGGRRGGGDTGH